VPSLALEAFMADIDMQVVGRGGYYVDPVTGELRESVQYTYDEYGIPTNSLNPLSEQKIAEIKAATDAVVRSREAAIRGGTRQKTIMTDDGYRIVVTTTTKYATVSTEIDPATGKPKELTAAQKANAKLVSTVTYSVFDGDELISGDERLAILEAANIDISGQAGYSAYRKGGTKVTAEEIALAALPTPKVGVDLANAPDRPGVKEAVQTASTPEVALTIQEMMAELATTEKEATVLSTVAPLKGYAPIRLRPRT
jgi:hypothetical protein